MDSDDFVTYLTLGIAVGFFVLMAVFGSLHDKREAARRAEEARREAERRARERREREEAERVAREREAQLARERDEAERTARTWEVMTEAERAALPIERRVEMLEVWERVKKGTLPPPDEPPDDPAMSYAFPTDRLDIKRASAWWPSSGWGAALMVLWLGLTGLAGYMAPMLAEQRAGRPMRGGSLLDAVACAGVWYLLTVFVRWLMLSAARAAARGQREP